MRHFIETQLGLTFLIGAVLGLIFPYGASIPDYSVVLVLAVVTFISSYNIDLKALGGIFSRQTIIFCIVRFALLPVLLWYIAAHTFPEYALGVLLISLVPAGVASPALSHVYKGNVALACVITLITAAMALLLIPVLIGMLEQQDMDISMFSLFRTQMLCIVLPMALYVLLRKQRQIKAFSAEYGKFIAVTCVAAIIFIVITKERQNILQDPAGLILPALITIVCYVAYAMVMMLFSAKRDTIITYGVCSTFNNSALGVSLALIHLDTHSVLMTISSEVVWAIMPFIFQPLVQRYTRTPESQ